VLLLFILYVVLVFPKIVHRNALSTNSHILFTCDNTYIMESKDELVFDDFFSSNTPCCL
jgi:hypothetical protein